MLPSPQQKQTTKPDTTNIQDEIRTLYASNPPATTATPWTPSINFTALPASAPPFSASALPPINQDMWRELQAQTQQQTITPSAWQLPAAAFASPQQTAPSTSSPMQQSTTAAQQQTANLIDLDWNETTTATTQPVQQLLYPQITQPESVQQIFYPQITQPKVDEVDTELQAGFLAATDAEFDEILAATSSYDLNTLLTNFKQGFSINYGSLTPAFQAKFESRAKRIIVEKLSAAQEEAALTIRPTTASLYPPLASAVEGYSERHYAAPTKIINTDEAFQAAELSLALDEFYLFADQPGTDRQLVLASMDNLSEHYQQLTAASKLQFANFVELNARRQAEAREAAASAPTMFFSESERARQQIAHEQILLDKALVEFGSHVQTYDPATALTRFTTDNQTYKQLPPARQAEFKAIAMLQLEVTDRPDQRQVAAARR